MRNRINFISGNAPYTLPTAAPAAVPWNLTTIKTLPNYFIYNHTWNNLHLLIEADSAWNNPLVASIVEIYGYAEAEDGSIQTPALIQSTSVSEPSKVDVEIIANPVGYKYIYVRLLSGTAAKCTIIAESRDSHNGESAHQFS